MGACHVGQWREMGLKGHACQRDMGLLQSMSWIVLFAFCSSNCAYNHLFQNEVDAIYTTVLQVSLPGNESFWARHFGCKLHSKIVCVKLDHSIFENGRYNGMQNE